MRIRHSLSIVVILSVLAAGIAAAAPAGQVEDAQSPEEPMKVVKDAVDQVLDILRDPELAGENNTEKRRKAVREVVDKRFHWREMARRALARHWRDRTEQEQEEFTRLFADLIERTYIQRVEKHADAEIRYQEQEVQEEYATVKTVAVADEDTEVPLDYRLHLVTVKDEETEKERRVWKVYDVKIEGVSLVNNYRTQFNDIIIGSSYEKLVKRIKAKLEKDD